MRKGSVAIVGAGWLGFELGKHLLQSGYTVYASTTSEDNIPKLEAAGFRAAVVTLPLTNFSAGPQAVETCTEAELWSAEQLVLNIPPERGDAAERSYPAAVVSAVLTYRRNQPSGRIIFCSSTGIYGNATGPVTVETPIQGETPRVRALALAESHVQTQSQRPTTILRLGGLIGGDRHPGKYFAGRTNIPNGDAPVNLVHRDHVIEVIIRLLDHPFWKVPILNVVDDDHPTRREYYTSYAREHGLALPTFLDGGANGKIVG